LPDDLHWIDPDSAELMQSLLPLVISAPILSVGAQRRQGSGLPNDWLAGIQTLISAQTVQLRRQWLSTAQSEALLDEFLYGAVLLATLPWAHWGKTRPAAFRTFRTELTPSSHTLSIYTHGPFCYHAR
jgi:hypothetical protein